MTIPLEVCVDTAEGLIACTQGGADRIELCSCLSVGGLTPSIGLMERAARLSIDVHAMIRPQTGGFIGSPAMQDQMKRDIEHAKALGLAGVVFGALTEHGDLDQAFMHPLIKAADGMEITLHRAFDLTATPMNALETAINMGVHRILTSGGTRTAIEGTKALANIKAKADGRIKIAAGSGITATNVGALLEKTGVDEVHASCSSLGNPYDRVAEFGFGPRQDRFTDAVLIREMKSALELASIGP